ncbi:MAG: hypothetical protein JWM93_132 [Frankiales bacterium]|nr:hypothetical protein [Frankiales bacterium]
MTELKDAFARSAEYEPPMHVTRQEILRAGRSRQLRRNVVASVGGLAVAGLVVTAVVALSPAQQTGVGTAAAAGQSSVDDKVATVPDDLGFAAVKASRTAKLDAILQATKAQLTGAGYAVPEFGVDDSVEALLNSKSPTGSYNMKLAVGKGGKTGAIVLTSGRPVIDSAVPTTCDADSKGCSIAHLPGGATVMFTDVGDAGPATVGRRVTVWDATVTEVSFLVDAGVGLTLSDDLLLTLGTAPELDLSDVANVTAAQRAAIDAALAAQATEAPVTKPTEGDLKATKLAEMDATPKG